MMRIQVLVTDDDLFLVPLRGRTVPDLHKGPVFKVKESVAKKYLDAQRAFNNGDYETWDKVVWEIEDALPSWYQYDQNETGGGSASASSCR